MAFLNLPLSFMESFGSDSGRATSLSVCVCVCVCVSNYFRASVAFVLCTLPSSLGVGGDGGRVGPAGRPWMGGGWRSGG